MDTGNAGRDKTFYRCSFSSRLYVHKVIAATGNVEGAEFEREMFHKALVRVPSVAMLDGELEYRKAKIEAAWGKLAGGS